MQFQASLTEVGDEGEGLTQTSLSPASRVTDTVVELMAMPPWMVTLRIAP